MAHPSLFALSCIICITLASPTRIDPDWKTFTDPNQSNYSTLLVTVHNVIGDVYMATIDNLYHLDADLVLKKKVATGPQMACKSLAIICAQRVQKHFIPHAMQIVYHLEPHYLMLCSSLYDGLCQLRPLNDLDRFFWIGPYDDQVSQSTRYIGSPAFFGPGYGNQIVFYSGTNWIPDNNTGDPLPFFSSKVLVHERKEFSFKYSYKSASSRMSSIVFRAEYPQIILYSFIHGSYVYILFLRYSSSSHTVLARICIEDGSFTSYNELRLACGPFVHDHSKMATSAFFGPGLEEGQPVELLYVTFNKLICDYNIIKVNELMATSVEKCFKGEEGHFRINLDNGDALLCLEKSHFESSYYCGSDVNPYIATSTVFLSFPTIVLPMREVFVTSLVVFEQNKTIVGFIGLKNGNFAKVLIRGREGRTMLDLQVAEGRRVQPSPAFDLKQEHIYLLVHTKIIKYPIGSCSIHKTCAACFEAKDDPLDCGWCDGRCARRQECPPTVFSRSDCSLSIHSITQSPMGSCSIHKTCAACFEAKDDPLECGWCDGQCTQSKECPPSIFNSSNCSLSIHSVLNSSDSSLAINDAMRVFAYSIQRICFYYMFCYYFFRRVLFQ